MHPLSPFIVSIIDNPPQPVAVAKKPFVYLAYEDERIAFTVNGDGAIGGVQRLFDNDPIWPIVTADDKAFQRLDDGQTAMLVNGAKRAIADGKLERSPSL